MKLLKLMFYLLFLLVFVSGCAPRWYNHWALCGTGAGVAGGIIGGSTTGGSVAGAATGAVAGGLLCYLIREYDSDGDGVPDDQDKCPNTPLGVKVDKHGCPLDSDGDGVPDHLDFCPDTPTGVEVDANGCPLDTDGDGVPDFRDECPDTPEEAIVDERGCPLDTDGDGVPDFRDECPRTPKGVQVDEKGCPLKKEGKIILQGIKFQFDSAAIEESSKIILDTAATILVENPDIRVRIEGHTCNIGTAEYNLDLSQRRAESTKEYLVSRGISSSRMETVGKGEAYPVASNATEGGRVENRRIEFVVIE
jgi:OOP family OmpA-OmpF porin